MDRIDHLKRQLDELWLHLIRHGYAPVLIDPAKDKPAYFEALENRAPQHYLHVLQEAHGARRLQ